MTKPYIKVSYRIDNNTGVLLGCYKIMCYNGVEHKDIALDYVLHETTPATFEQYQQMDIELSQWFRPDAIVKPWKSIAMPDSTNINDAIHKKHI